MKYNTKKIIQKYHRYLVATLGYFLAGVLVPTIWSYFASPFGYLAGFIAAIIAIFPLWYIVHYKGMVKLNCGDIVVDMGLGISTAVFIRDAIDCGWNGVAKSFMTMFLVTIGAILAGFSVHYLQELRRRKNDN